MKKIVVSLIVGMIVLVISNTTAKAKTINEAETDLCTTLEYALMNSLREPVDKAIVKIYNDEVELVNRLLEVEMTISYKGKTKVIDKLVIDNGASHTLNSSDIVDDLGIYFENGVPLISAYGIGGEE